MRKKFKKFGVLLLALAMALAFSGCGSDSSSSTPQTASAWLTNEGTEINVVIDLTGGWSVDFALGAAYLYDADTPTDQDCTALLNMLDKNVYDEYVAEAKKSDTLNETESAMVYTNEQKETAYLFSPTSGAYFMLTVKEGVEGDPVFARVQPVVEQGAGMVFAGSYGYDGSDMEEYAVYQYMAEEMSKKFDEADAHIPIVNVIDKDETNPDDVLIKGDFWILNYNIDGDTLKETSGGAFPGCLHLAKQEDETYKVTSFDVVADGSDYDSSAKEIFGDKYEDFVKVSSDDKARADQTYKNITTYVNANEVPVTKYEGTDGTVTDLHL